MPRLINRTGRSVWRRWYVADLHGADRLEGVLQSERSIPSDVDEFWVSICATWREIRQIFRLADVPMPRDYVTVSTEEWRKRQREDNDTD